ncbi:MAG: flagellar hook-associated protein FlgK [Phycisphaerales bacterium]|jgi:flagellar hook-associated protein 1 FlgK|nr:flagellar hook-associated protein FlgK [Phycisphaerales bacterium]
MSLTGTLQIGRSALTAGQLGIQIAGQNMANATTPGYSRQTLDLRPIVGARSGTGFLIGRGVEISGLRREVDAALQSRLRDSVASEASAQQALSVYDAIESTLNELTGYDLSSELNTFFGTWSERANLVQSSAVVVQAGRRVAEFVNQLRGDLGEQRSQIERQLGSSIERADTILTEVAGLNEQIAAAEQGRGVASSLRDRRDQLLGELSTLIDVSVVEQTSGAVDVLAGSTPILYGNRSLGLELLQESGANGVDVRVVTKDGQRTLDVSAGSVGSLLDLRENAVGGTIERLDEIAATLIFEVNKLHSTGTNAEGLRTTTGTLGLALGDRTRSLNDPLNATLGGLPFEATNGGFVVHVKNSANGTTQSVRIDVDLDGLGADGRPSFADDTSAEDIRAALNAIDGLNASFTSDGRLKIDADTGFEFSFENDTSGALAVLGVNAYFTGTDAQSIGVRNDLVAQPSLLMAGRRVGGELVENGTALEVVALQSRTLDALGGQSIRGAWGTTVQAVALDAQAAKTRADATTAVRESLEAQNAAVSGVNVDEETINLLNFQRQYQGGARLISVADQLLQELMAIV